MNIGARVGAIQSADEESVKLLGWGVYQGYKEHPEWGFENPCMLLDNGETVWGCECWWEPEEKIKELIGKREIIIVPVKAREQE